MTNTDELLSMVGTIVHDARHGLFIDEASDRIIAAIYADIAARALSDEVVEAVAEALSVAAGMPGKEGRHPWHAFNADAKVGIAALLLALGITESEAEV